MQLKLAIKFSSMPMPMTNGLTTIPLACRARLTAQGSSSHASMPSVINTMTLRPGVSGKSPAASSKERAIGVVPWARTLPRVCLIIRLLNVPNGTNNSVSSQSCLPGTCLVPWPYTRKPNSSPSLPCSDLRDSLRSSDAVVIFR